MNKMVSCKVTLMYLIYCTVPFGTLFPPVLALTSGRSSYKSCHSTLTAHFCMRPSTLTTLLHHAMEELMLNGGGVEDGDAKPPARRQVAEWIVRAYKSITKQTDRNAWKKMGYQWFFD